MHANANVCITERRVCIIIRVNLNCDTVKKPHCVSVESMACNTPSYMFNKGNWDQELVLFVGLMYHIFTWLCTIDVT
jgi:hypothetical protein